MECDEEIPVGYPIGSIVNAQLDSVEESFPDDPGTAPEALDEEILNHEFEDIPEPKVGMLFESEKAAYDYYSEYGRRIGFSIRWDTRTRSRITGETISRRFLCNKQGFRVERQKSGDPLAKYHRGETRCGCKAFMRIKLGNDGKFQISELYNTHNHDLVIPQKVTESKIEKKLVLPAVEAEYKNFLKTKCGNPLKKFNFGLLLDYFMGKQAEDPCFFYTFQLDDNGLISNVFWADGKMRADFLKFGDVLCFDKMITSSDHGWPMTMFIGVNHHVQLTLFGAALMYDQTADSLRWLFKAFVDAMFGRIPETVYTDFDETTFFTIRTYFPNSSHRFSAWHLYKAALKNLSHVITGFPDFDDDIRKCIFDGDNEAEFLKNWAEMLQKYDLAENSWLQEKFEDRANWAPAYGGTTFSADINNVWRSDSLCNELEAFLNLEKDINLFLCMFDKLLLLRRNLELDAHAKMMQSLPYAPPIGFLQHAARVYTPNLFKMFTAEYGMSQRYFIKSRHFDGSIYILTVEDSKHYEHIVTVNLSQEIVNCSCHKFECVGIFCGHIMNCVVLDLRYIPEIYILKRWTRGAGNIPLNSQEGTPVFEESKPSSLPTRYNNLGLDFVLLSLRAAEDEDLYNCALKHKLDMYEDMDKIMKEKTSSVRIVSSGNMFGGSQARNNAIGRNFGPGSHFSWIGDSASRNKA